MNGQTKNERHNRTRARGDPTRLQLIRQAAKRVKAKKPNTKTPKSAKDVPKADFVPPEKIRFDGSLAENLLDLVREKNVELVTTALDRLWRKSMNGGTLMGEDFEAIDAAKKFLREVSSNTS